MNKLIKNHRNKMKFYKMLSSNKPGVPAKVHVLQFGPTRLAKPKSTLRETIEYYESEMNDTGLNQNKFLMAIN